MYIYIYINIYIYMYTYTIYIALSRLLPCAAPALLPHSKIHLLKITQQTSLPCDTADMSAVGHSGHVCCVTRQTCLLSPTAGISPG